MLLVWHAEKSWSVPHMSSSFVLFKDYMSNMYLGQHCKPSLYLLEINKSPPEYKRVSLILDGLNQLLVFPDTAASFCWCCNLAYQMEVFIVLINPFLLILLLARMDRI